MKVTSSIYGPDHQTNTIHGAFQRIAQQQPRAVAAADDAQQITYGQLADEADVIARQLKAAGVQAGDIVPVVARRSVHLPAVLLGILGAGAAYGLLDVRWPARRLHQFIARMRPPLVLGDADGQQAAAGCEVPVISFKQLMDLPRAVGELPQVGPADRATVFWTSGSTGTPKAVESPHQATTRLYTGPGYLDYRANPVQVHAAAVAWDAYTLEVWGMLLQGGTLLVHTPDVLLPSDLRYYVGERGATHLFLTPSLADVIVGGDIGCLEGLATLIMGGDKPNPATCARLLDTYPAIELVNGYGPVESCVFGSVRRISRGDIATTSVPAGAAVPGTGVHIVDDDNRVVPRGDIGQIALTGTGLAYGYLGDRAQTAAAFRDIHTGTGPQRAYLTGDYGRITPEGVLHFAGRQDAQLKIAGHRIEPAEVEAAARALGTGSTIALALPDASGSLRLVLFAEPPTTGETEAQLHAQLRQNLPAYMVPTRIHYVASMPLLDNTKVDKQALKQRFGYSA